MVHVPPAGSTHDGPVTLPKQQRMLLDALAGAAAGCISRVIVAPLDLVKIRLQVQLEPVVGASPVSKYTGFTNAIATVLREEGVLVGGVGRGGERGLVLGFRRDSALCMCRGGRGRVRGRVCCWKGAAWHLG
jgi:hypothetical protein